VALNVLGQTLSGNFSVVNTGGVITLEVDNAALSLGGGLASISGASASITLDATGLAGTFEGTVAVNVPGVSVNGTLEGQIDTHPGSRYVRIATPQGAAGDDTSVDVQIAGQSIHALVSFEQSTNAAGQTVVKVAVSHDADATDPLLQIGPITINDASGQLIIGPAGIAAKLTIPSGGFDLGLPTGMALDGDFSIAVNTMPTAVHETFLLGGVATPARPACRTLCRS